MSFAGRSIPLGDAHNGGTQLKLVLDNGTEVRLDYADSTPEGELLLLGYDTDHGDILCVTITLPLIKGPRIRGELGLAGEGVDE